MPKCKFFIVDVFAERKFEGNQLAVFICEEPLFEAEMQKVAKEMNYSETTFITSKENYDVRIFTPEVELPFAGHPTIGTAFVIQQELIKGNVKTILLNLKIGPIPVLFKYKSGKPDLIWMEQNPPSFGKFFDTETISQILRINESDIDDRFPIQEVSTGGPFIIVPLKTLDSLKRANVDVDKCFELLKKTEAKSILIFCSETRKKGNDLSVRVFAHYHGIPEDPATGSGNGCLAAYLVKHDYFNKNRIDIKVEQGYEVGRPSLLYLRAEGNDEEQISVSVGGKVILTAIGELIDN
ncbi:MAG: PhzF family phenazine biosynthesis protein [Candidatus Thorarchaeota archaeon]